MDTLACVKRVPDTGAKIVLTDDQRAIDASNLGFTMSPHEECGLEEAVQVAQDTGGTATALTLGTAEADEQLRTALAMQADEAVLLETDDAEWGPLDTATAIADYLEETDAEFDVLFFGTESADNGNYQVPVHVATQLGLPVVTGIKTFAVEGDTLVARREARGGEEVFELEPPAVVGVKEGLNEPRYPSMRSKMRARKQEVEQRHFDPPGRDQLEMVRLDAPEQDEGTAEILGEGPEAVDRIVEILADDLEVL